MTWRVVGPARLRRGVGACAAVAAGALVLAVAPARTVEARPAELPAAAAADVDAAPLPGAPVAPAAVELTQPDGSTVRAVPWGDRSMHGYETPDGHTVVQAASGEWRYAAGREGDGELDPGPIAADEPAPARAPVHQRPAASTATVVEDPAVDVASSAPSRGAFVPMTGDQPTLVVLARFSDQAPVGTGPAHWADRFFGEAGSVRDYYDEVSYGNLGLVPAAETSGTANGVVGWVDVGYDHPNSGANASTGWQDDLQLARSAITAANRYVDYASFDLDDDGVVGPSELHVVVIAAGYETSYSGPEAQCGPAVWAHNWELFELTPTIDGVAVGGNGGSYSMFGEYHCVLGADEPGAPASIGVMAHELGHDLGWPDLYDVDYTSAGIGAWSLMAAGSWTRASTSDRLGSSPVHPDAWSKLAQGWVDPDVVSGSRPGVQLEQVASAPDVAQVLPNPAGVDWRFGSPGSGMYFLVENRQPTGYDAGLPGCGLLVWRVDESLPGDNSANSIDNRRLVDLVEADRTSDLDDWDNLGDAGDPFPGSTGNFWLGPRSSPSTVLPNWARSDVDLWPITESCASTMVADISAPVAPEICPPDDQFEPNDTPQTATPLTTHSVEGVLCTGDTDHYVVESTASGRVRVHLDHAMAFGDLDVVVTELSSGRQAIGSSPFEPDWAGFDSVSPGSFLVTVSGSEGAQNAYTLEVETPEVPDRPYDVVGQPQNGAVKVSWFPPSWLLGTGLTYRATASPGGQWCEVEVSRSCTVTGLTNGTRYRFSVVSIATTGTSSPSAPSDPVVPAAVPSVPSGVTATAGTGSALVSWKAPTSNGGSRITSYRVIASPGGAVCDAYVGLSCTVTELTNGTPYTFRVGAYNTTGRSYLSAPSPAVTPGLPGAPTAVAGTPHDGSVAVSWAAPASAGGSAITGYEVTAAPGGHTCTSAALTCTVTGLANGTPHTFAVRATNTFGSGPASAASAPVTPRTVPGVPGAVAAEPRNHAVLVSWTPPATDGGASISGYRVRADDGSATCRAIDATSCLVRSLTNGRAYRFQVRAVNAAGAGAWSAPSATVRPRTVPGVPRDVRVAPRAGALRVEWDAPASDGGAPVVAYTATASPGGRTCTVTARACTLGDLARGQSYVVRVRATNAAGDGPWSDRSGAVAPT